MLIGSICGFSVVDSTNKAAATHHPIGTVLALVEEGSGGSLEVPLEELELI